MTTNKLMVWFGPVCLIVLVILALSVPQALAVPGMASWWPAENNVADSVGSNNGTLQGGANYGPGVAGKGFQLNGINGFVNIPHSDSLNFGTADFSVGLWVKFANASTQQVPISINWAAPGRTPRKR